MIGFLERAAMAAVITALSACASPSPHAHMSADVNAMFAALPAIVTPPVVPDFDKMRAALPSFDLQRSSANDTTYGDVSVIRDIGFAADTSILSDPEVARLDLLKAYLRAHGTVEVRIEGYGDGGGPADREAELSIARAQAVKRALMTDMMVTNTIDCIGAPRPQSARRKGSVEVIFIRPEA